MSYCRVGLAFAIIDWIITSRYGANLLFADKTIGTPSLNIGFKTNFGVVSWKSVFGNSNERISSFCFKYI